MDLVARKFVCPCCGYAELDVPPYANIGLPPWIDHGAPPYWQRYGEASYDVGSCCGFEFGYDDEPGDPQNASTFAEYLHDWKSRGCIWFETDRRPAGWSLEEQLRKAGIYHETHDA